MEDNLRSSALEYHLRRSAGKISVTPTKSLVNQRDLALAYTPGVATLDAANIAFKLSKTTAGDGVTVGPILFGVARPVHNLTPSATVRRIVNMSALMVVDVNASHEGPQAQKA